MSYFDYQPMSNDPSLQNSVLEWIDQFQVDDRPDTFNDLFNGLAIYQLLNRIDITIWPKSKIYSGPQSEDQSIENFNNVISGLEQFYQQKLDVIANNHTARIDVVRMVMNRDSRSLFEVVELVMGVVINCEEKQEYIERMLDLEEKTQEDLKKLIEKALHRLSVEMSEASQISDSTAHMEMQQTIERLERERKLLREKSLEYENENKQLR